MNSRFRIVVAIGLAVSLLTASLSAAAQDNDNDNDIDIDPFPEHQFEIHGFEFHEPEFFDVWARTDFPVQQLETERSWLWGPAANTPLFEEPYVEAEDGMRGVQYSDKSRMEMPVPGSAAAADDEDSPWNITQGLLATELMTGNLQLGDDTFVPYPPAEISVAGDWEDNPGPTYADMAVYMDWEPRPAGGTITQYFDDEGVVQDDERFAEYGVTDEYYIAETDHNIASVFWDFMQSEGLVYEDGDLTTGPVFLDEFYAVGFPTTEAYWGEFRLRGEVQDILVQCFERRCLTYAPNNPVEWQVESGNIGLHYHEWRYSIIDEPIVDPELGLVVEPEEATNEVGTEFSFTATVMENGTAVAIDDQDDVSISVTRSTDENDDNDNNGVDVDENITVDEAGVATISYTGPDAPAVDTITVDVDYNDVQVSATATKTWVEPDPDPEISLILDPVDATNEVGTEYALTAALAENDTAHAIEDVDDVSIAVTRDGDDVNVEETITLDDAGVATISYTGPEEPAVDTIAVTVDYNDEQISATATKTWTEADPAEELSGTFTFNGETTAQVEVEDEIVLTAHVTVNGEDAALETVYFWIDEEDQDIVSIDPFSATTDFDGTADVTVTGLAEGTAEVNAFVDVDDTGVYNPDTDVDLGSVEVVVGPVVPEEFEATASDAGDVLSEGQLEDGRDYWQIEIFLTEEDRDADNPLNPQDAWDAGELTRIIYERPDGTAMDLEPEGTAYLWWVGTYADGQHTVYYEVDGEWYAVTSTFEDGELVAVNEDPYTSPDDNGED